MSKELPRACIIGAGTSGLICAKVFKEHGIPYDCFEKGSGLGGIWRFKNDNGMSTCYRSLHINTSKRMMVLSDFPFKDSVAEYPTHEEILDYFEEYTDHFGIRDSIEFKTEVKHVSRTDEGTWRVEISKPDKPAHEVRYYDFVAVVNGHHWDPRLPKFPGKFNGIEMHAHHYVDSEDPHDLRDKRVVIVGMGNSAMDIACELAHRGQGAGKVFLAQRSGVWIVPKILGNTPQDEFVRHPMVEPTPWEKFRRKYIPVELRRKIGGTITEAVINMAMGKPSRVGLKDPKEPLSMRHPTISSEIHNRLVHGDVTPKGNIAELMGKQVKFEDGSVEDVDAIIYATGYNITFPFFDKDFLSAPNNSIPLWQRIFDPRYPDLAFVALVQPLCSMMPIAELQSNFIASYLTGETALPAPAQMESEMRRYDEMMKKRFTNSPSHTIQIDCPEYSFFLREAWEKGKARARAAGSPIPIKRRASEKPEKIKSASSGAKKSAKKSAKKPAKPAQAVAK